MILPKHDFLDGYPRPASKNPAGTEGEIGWTELGRFPQKALSSS